MGKLFNCGSLKQWQKYFMGHLHKNQRLFLAVQLKGIKRKLSKNAHKFMSVFG
jgi:hypothetical protein